GQLLLVPLLAHVPATQVSTYALVNPVIALALGALVLHERVTSVEGLCAVLVVAGVALVLWQGTAGRRPCARIGGIPKDLSRPMRGAQLRRLPEYPQDCYKAPPRRVSRRA
ncbi:MAG: EamA family transporter, partial [Steroidobacteraceae bacterium]